MKEKFQKIYEAMARKGQTPVGLFALLRMDDLVDKWSVIYAEEAVSSSDVRRNEIFSDLLDEIKKELSVDELNKIARIVVLTLDDHLAQSLLKYKTGDEITNAQVNGNFVHEGYVMKSLTISEQVEKATPSIVGISEADLKGKKSA